MNAEDDLNLDTTGADVTALAFDLIDSDRQAEETAARDKYVSILRRRYEPEANDAQELAAVLKQLNLSRDDVKSDIELLNRMAEYEAEAVGRADAIATKRTAFNERKAMRERHEQEAKAADKKFDTADRKLTHIEKRGREIADLRRQRPDLFGVSV